MRERSAAGRPGMALGIAALAGLALAAHADLGWGSGLSLVILLGALLWAARLARAPSLAPVMDAAPPPEAPPVRVAPSPEAATMAADNDFIATAAHDLRQPLQALSLFAATLGTHSLPANARQLAQDIEASTDALSVLFEAVMALVRLDAGRESFILGSVPLAFVLEDAVGAYLDEAHARSLHLRHVPTRLAVQADSAQLMRLLEILVAHAVDTAEDGGVLVGARRRGDQVRIEVWNTGAGIPADQLADVLQPFSAYGKRFTDRALGLVRAARLARRMGGTLDVQTREGRGTVFLLALPRASERG
ncbi:MAG: HAMP domain-containing sensor histidine kinase [Rhodocyclaceae bacterium]